ncbi:ABC transporter permease [Williamsia sp. Leaf354]|jgi:phospholipid/cholesterol/gamma-HCH transport system permease protein|uniref:MlaE family ABC transporter permease n=1 Tax=Williamsia sp. Leaf354 TaxID=1736349 RepID=UPI0006F1E670|nr:ABC transporter permease [Williamsia sp. Leaf354]KQR96199.1 ABC transporter permease [Williamsia sp. Leaf354]
MSSATTRGVEKVQQAGHGALSQTGNIVQLFIDVARNIFVRPFQLREFIQQAWFIASVTILPTALIAIPFGAIVSLQTSSLIKQLGAESFTGAASVLIVLQQAAPIITSLLIAGAAGSAVAADLGSRTIREEIDAMRVLGINPIQRLVVPRVLAMVLVGALLNGLVCVVGIGGGYFFNVVVQNGTPGAYLASFSALAQLPDLYVATLKAAIFGVIAGVIAAYKGLTPKGGPKGVGEAVNQSVVITFLLLFFANLIITAVYLQIVPAKGS